jgi:hypothetical protein
VKIVAAIDHAASRECLVYRNLCTDLSASELTYLFTAT